jgi:hypothetical protein
MFFNSQLIKKSFRKCFFNNLIKTLRKRFLTINLIKKTFRNVFVNNFKKCFAEKTLRNVFFVKLSYYNALLKMPFWHFS